jgi:Spy/CpxP family protein refolding chaperone
MKHRQALALWLSLFLCLAVGATAQPPAEDPIAQHLFPPDLIMKYGSEIGLDERQRGAVKDAVQKAQAKFVDAQWDLQEESQKLVRLLQARPVDETAVLAEADKVMALEREIKRTQLSLLVRLKNLLTEAQQARLTELRRSAR